MVPTLEEVAAVITLIANHGIISQTRLVSQMQESKRTIAQHGGEFMCGIHCFHIKGTDELGYQVTMMMKRPEGWRRWLKVTDESYLAIRRADELGIPIA